MPEVTDLGYCPRCTIDLTEEPIGYIKHVRFCKLCRDFLRAYPVLADTIIQTADNIKRFSKQCNPRPITNDTKP